MTTDTDTETIEYPPTWAGADDPRTATQYLEGILLGLWEPDEDGAVLAGLYIMASAFIDKAGMDPDTAIDLVCEKFDGWDLQFDFTEDDNKLNVRFVDPNADAEEGTDGDL